MSHYRPNLEDLLFNLFEVHNLPGLLDSGSHLWPELDRDSAEDLLREVSRFSQGVWAEAFIPADRTPPELQPDGEVSLAPELKTALAAARSDGWSLLGVSGDLGGVDLPALVFWAAQEMLLGANPTAAFYSLGALFAQFLHEEGTPEQRDIAALIVERNWATTMVLTEPDAGSDVGAGTTRATHVSGDVYYLEGVKRFITSGEHDSAENILHLVLARPDGAAPGTKGLSLFLVPKFLFDVSGNLEMRNGVRALSIEHKMGLVGSVTAELGFGDAAGLGTPAVGYLVGGVHDGIRQMFKIISSARMMIGTKSAATLSTGYLNALAYAKERIQGPDLAHARNPQAPKVPIICHPDVRRMLLLQKAYSEGLRALYTYTAFCQDMARLDPDSGFGARAELLLPLVKGYSSEAAFSQLTQALQVFGGAGYTKDVPLEQYLRDTKIDSIYEGTTGIQALDLLFRKVVRDNGAAVLALGAEISEFIDAAPPEDVLAPERQMLQTAFSDTQTLLGTLVANLAATHTDSSDPGLYKAALHATALLFSMAELVIAYQLCRHAEVASTASPQTDFHRGKLASARVFLRHVAPLIQARNLAAATEDGLALTLPDSAF